MKKTTEGSKMLKLFITGESGTIPMAMQRLLLNHSSIQVINNQLRDPFQLMPLKMHQDFKVRLPELDFCDRNLLFAQLSHIWEATDIIIHSGAYVGTDFCQANPNKAIETNIQGTKNIVDVCNQWHIPLIYFSTTAIFDPRSYSRNKPIDESTKIDPQTLYGITKYSGELIVKRECRSNYIIVRPVFGYSEYPDDLHSALTKVIYKLYHSMYLSEMSSQTPMPPLNVLLDKDITKSYTHVENIAAVVIQMIENFSMFANQEFNVGENYKNALNWYQLIQIIAQKFHSLLGVSTQTIFQLFDKNIVFSPQKDYLHYHNIDDSRLKQYNVDFDTLGTKYVSIEMGIERVCKSVITNINQQPYWI